jgi:hypothetical protein
VVFKRDPKDAKVILEPMEVLEIDIDQEHSPPVLEKVTILIDYH